MDIIELTRQLGAALQEDDRFKKCQEAMKANEANPVVKEKTEIMQVLQAAYQGEMQKEAPDQAAMEKMDEDFKMAYLEMMNQDTMKAFNEARDELNGVLNYMVQLLYLCANGEDPKTCEPSQDTCGGDCGSCGGGCGC